MSIYFYGFLASGRDRTDDLLITNQLLYQLSYASNRYEIKSPILFNQKQDSKIFFEFLNFLLSLARNVIESAAEFY